MRHFVRAVLHGLSGAGLFRPLRYPGEPETLLGAESVEETLKSPEYRHMIRASDRALAEAEAKNQELAEYYARLYYGRVRETHEHTDASSYPTR